MNQQHAPARSSFHLNRRAHPRYSLVRRPAVLHIANARELCVVRNISSGGLMASIFHPRLPGEYVRVELVSGELIEGSILWTRDWSIGIAFKTAVDVDRLLAQQWVEEAQEERRSSPRLEIDCRATLRVNARFYYGRARDISSGGARFETSQALKKPGPALLMLPDLPPLRSAIRWTRGNEFGLAFDEIIPAEALGRWVADRSHQA